MFHRGVFLLVAFSLFYILGTDQAIGQEFAIGDKVKVEIGRQIFEGEIVEAVFEGKMYRVKHLRNGREVKSAYPSKFITKVSNAAEDPTEELPKARKWTSSNGKFEVVASLSEVSAGVAKLITDDGRSLKVAVNQLSQADQDHLKSIQSEVNPFAGGTPIGNDKSGSSSTPPPSAMNANVKKRQLTAKPNAGKRIALRSTPTYSVEIDAEDLSKTVQPSPTTFYNGDHEKTFFNQSEKLVKSADGEWAGVAIVNPFNKKHAAIELFNLKTGKTASRFTLGPVNVADPIGAPGIKLVGVISNEKAPIAVTLSVPFGFKPAQVDAWRFHEDKLEHLLGWEAKAKTGQLINDDRILTTDREGNSIVWDLKKAVSLFSFDAKKGTQPVLSNTGRQIAFSNGNSIYIINSESGDVLGKLDSGLDIPLLSFSRDGKKLAAFETDTIEIFDLTTGTKLDQFSVSNDRSIRRSLQWADNEHVLLNGINLVNIRLRVVAWRFRELRVNLPMTRISGDYFCYSTKAESGEGELIPTQLPLNEIREQTAGLNPDELLVLRPGTRIALDLRLPFGGSDNQKIKEHFENQLKSNGYVIDPNAAIVLKAYSKKGKSQTREYQKGPGFGRPYGSTESVSFRSTHFYIEIVENDTNIIWQNNTSSGPGSTLFLDEGESAQQAASKAAKGSPRFFLKAKIPKNYSKLPDGKKEIGRTQMTEDGLK